MRLAPVLACAAIAVALSPDLAHLSLEPRAAMASVSLELSVADLLKESSAVVVATPRDSRAVWEDIDGVGQRIVTYTRATVDRAIDGEAKTGEDVWIRTLGGRVGRLGQHVEGEAVLPIGEQAMLFLRTRPDGTRSVTGMAQGHFPLVLAPSGAARILVPSSVLGGMVAKRDATAPAARLELSGHTIDEVVTILGSVRQIHAR